jgi:GTP-binding protein
MADIPGLIEGAHEGHGLGMQFLRHLSRTSVLLHLLDISDPERDPLQDYDTINHELACFDPELEARRQLTAVTKLDLPTTRERLPEIKEAFTRRGITLMAVSAVTGEGLQELLWQIVHVLEARKAENVGEKTGEPEQWP